MDERNVNNNATEVEEAQVTSSPETEATVPQRRAANGTSVRALNVKITKLNKELATAKEEANALKEHISMLEQTVIAKEQDKALIAEQNRATMMTVLNTLKNTVNVVTLLIAKGE